jgi:hypothetical protein
MLQIRWRQLFGAYQGWQAARIAAALARAQAEEGEARRRLPGWLRLRNLDPERQVRYYYLSILHHAAEAGVPRQKSETPYTYGPRLAEHLPPEESAPEAVTDLTDAFVQVRYAGGPISPERLAQAKSRWAQLKRLLRL